MNSFKRLSFILLFVFLTSSAFAQKSPEWTILFSWDRFNAGEFGIAELYPSENNPSSIYGVGVEYKLAYQWALQVGFGFFSGSSEETGEGTSSEFSQTRYGFTAGPVYYFRGYNAEGVRPYLGLRLNIGGYSVTDEATSGTTKQTDEYSTSSLGFALYGGADVEILDGLRVGAGYGIGYASFPESELTRTVTSPGATQTTTLKGPSASGFSTIFHMNVKFLF